jgi:hypothetical protein
VDRWALALSVAGVLLGSVALWAALRAWSEARALGRSQHDLRNAMLAKFGRDRLRRKWFHAELRTYLMRLREFLRWGPTPPPDFDLGPHEDDSGEPGKKDA